MIWALLSFSFFIQSALADSVSTSRACLERNLQKADQQKLAPSKKWKSLLHYSDGIWGERSDIDDPKFFLSAKGASRPEEELRETLAALCDAREILTRSPKIPRLSARCLYPAREQFLIESGLGDWPQPACPDLEEWKMRVGQEAVHLVFSSYYANNPSSVFGHSLLRFDKLQSQTGIKISPLLSYGVNYAANPTTTNGLLYAWFGMTGGFKGQFASLPYYYKVREYSDFDSRDLWEYELNLNAQQLQLVLNHLWEMGFTDLTYYYFSKNCAYQLMRTLEVAVPERDLHKSVPGWVIPIDSIKAVTRNQDLIRAVHFRPSLYKQWSGRMARLQQRHLEPAYQTAKDHLGQFEGALSENEKALILDALLDEWDFRYAKELLEPQSVASQQKQTLLAKRAVLPTTPPLEFKIEQEERPDLSHESARLGVGFVHRDRYGWGLGVDMRFALHDFLDPQYGYPHNATVEFFRLQGRYFAEENRAQLTEAKFFEIQLLAPLDSNFHTFSWKASVGLDRADFDCNDCLAGHVRAEGGYSLEFFGSRAIAYALVGGDVRLSGEQTRFLRARPMVTGGTVVHLPWDVHGQLQAEYFFDRVDGLPDMKEIQAELRKNLGQQMSLGLSGQRVWSSKQEDVEIRAKFYRFF